MDLVGFVSGGPDPANTQPSVLQGALQSVSVSRIYSHAVAANGTAAVTVKGAGGALPVDPSQIGAALVVVQVVSPTKSGAVLAYSGTRPSTRSLSMTAGASAKQRTARPDVKHRHDLDLQL